EWVWPWSCALCDRQGEADDGASRVALQLEGAAMRLDDRLAEREADAEALGLGGDERHEGVVEELPGKAGSGVGDADFDEFRVRRLRLDGHHAARRLIVAKRVDGVLYDIDQDLFDLEEVDHDAQQV